MLANSYFQALPPNVILSIVRTGLNRGCSAETYIDGLTMVEIKWLIALSHLCRSWRDIALSIVCHKHVITKGAQLPLSQFTITNNAYLNYIRKLEIHLDDNDILCGKVAQKFKSSEYRNMCLPYANTIKICVKGTRNSEQDDGNKENSTSDLAKYVKAAAPNATRMQVSHGEYPVARGKKYWESMQMFMNAYYRPSGTLIMELDSHYLIPDDGIEMTVHMSSLSFVWNECSNDALKLMKLQCSTLQEVTIHSIDTDDLSSLLLDDNGTVVTYPYLLNLTLDGQAGMEVTNRLEFEDAVPFPRLVKLNANIIYPFGDDVLFRGNSGSLEELSLNFDYATATIINRANVFTPGKYKKLKTVDIRSFIEDIDNCDKQVKHHMKLLQGVASTTKKLLIRDIDISQSFLEILPKSRLFKDIHTLCLNEIHLGLVDILEILTALSALQFLESGLVELVATTNSIGIHDLDTLCRKYSMINKCFYKWRVPQESIISVESGAQYAVILAMLCPRFRIIQLPDQHKPEYFEKVKHYMNGPYFLKYPNVQNRLLSIKSEYDCCV